jgi:ubiquinone/menaquinone biosynthesis C-methylase UbiE
MLKQFVYIGTVLAAVASLDAATPSRKAPNPQNNQISAVQTMQTPQTPLPKGHAEATLTVLTPYIKQNASILDLGNGTGIGARQLCKNGYHTVVGIEPNSSMIKAAEEGRTEGMCTVKYLEGNIKKGLPVNANSYDLVTAFTGFHWYADPASLKEVTRVLKPGGYFFIVRGLLKNSDPVRQKITSIIEEETGKRMPATDLHANKLLQDQGFKIVLDTSVPMTEYYTKNEYLNYVHSYDIWGEALKSNKIEAIQKKVDAYLDTLADANGLIKIDLKAPVILAQKQK